MISYYKYLPVSEEDKKWGLYVENAGRTSIRFSDTYPRKDHPKHHYFNWENGRILKEYQLIYITRGNGLFESAGYGLEKIEAGTVLMLFPDEWHRYKPDEKIGWDEYWIGFNGRLAENIIRHGFFSRQKPVLKVGVLDSVLQLFFEIIHETELEKSGYQPQIAGATMHLLGLLHSLSRSKEIIDFDQSERLTNQAIAIFRQDFNKLISIEDVAKQLNVSYSQFRKVFKGYTGISPGQYLIQLRIERARILLHDPKLSIKEIAYQLNFSDGVVFSKLFKRKTGFAPDTYRKHILSLSDQSSFQQAAG